MNDLSAADKPPSIEIREDIVRCGVLVLLWCGAIAAFVLPANFFFGVDDYFHIAVAEKMSQHGLVLDTFPWVDCSIWCDSYFDKEWLFHVLLVPFLAAGRILSGKLAIIFFNGLIVVSLWGLLRALRVKDPFWWLLLMPFLSFNSFWHRLTLCRPHLLSIALLALCLACMIRRRSILLGLCMAVYALSYTGHWQVVGLAIIYDFWYHIIDDGGTRRKRFKIHLPMTLPVVIGMIVGEMIHPSFPRNIHGLWVQNVLVLKAYWQGGNDALYAMRPLEMRALPVVEFLKEAGVLIIAMVALGVHAIRCRRPLPRPIWVFACYALLYLLMAAKSQRFMEYLIPVSGTLIVLYLSQPHNIWERWRKTVLAAIGVVAILGAIGTLRFALKKANELSALRNKPHYADCSAFIAANLKPGDLVVSMYWSDNPQLFWGAPEQRYLVFLDPMFMNLYDEKKFRAWDELRSRPDIDPVRILQDVFGARAIFIRRTYGPDGPVPLILEKTLRDRLGPADYSSQEDHLVFLIPPKDPQ